ncbi:LysR substrate-binding domain-containing protein [Variovorax sp. J22R133]|uniref:LysR substrate-binding domain-containing protein n=1 Tax=Variovorax brevis TaxID=3053503 RepID=UPI002574B27F|nr:LysR substrate-binding domain-containing protein [Variovorax sp. J22R133]MDM0115420.1 LysR substrate-binding domain-containing protein [Variovorax sp. J22R133]
MHYFVKIVDAGSFSRAATTAFVAQPALSQQMAELESELGVTLLHRSARGVRPTQAGEVLYREATQILRRVERLPELVRFSEGEVAGPVSLGMASTLASFLAGDFMAWCKTRLPKVALSFVTEDSATLKARLLAHSLDLAILFDEQDAPAGLAREPLFRQRLFLVDRQPLRGHRKSVQLRHLAGHPLMLPGQGNATRALIDSHFARSGITPNVAAEANVLPSMLSAVLSGLGATIVPLGEFTGTPWQDALVATPIDPPIYQTACAMWATDASLSSAGEAVRALLAPFAQGVQQRKAQAGMAPVESEEA